MKRLLFYSTLAALFLNIMGCNNEMKSNEVSSNEVSSNDSLGNEAYAITVMDTAKVSDALRNRILANELDLLKWEQRKYSLDEFDLNGDGKEEYFVGFENDFFCETNGCTFFILNNDGSLNSRIIAIYPPVTILSTKTNGWYDILVNSNSVDHKLSFDKGSYPSHPWTLPILEADTVIKENHFLKIILEGRADYTF